MDEDQINQDDIEALLRQAQAAGGEQQPTAPPENAAPKAPVDDVALDQSDIERLIAQAPSAESDAPAAASDAADHHSDVEILLNKAQEALASVDDPSADLPPGVKPFALNDLGGTPASTEAATLELVRDVQLDLKIELGRTHMHLEDVLRLKSGAVVPLDKLAGDPVDVLVNGRLIARGEVLVLNDNFCVRVTELVVGDSAVA